MTDGTMVPLSSERDMTTDEFKQWFRRLGLTQVELARRLDVNQAQISRWYNGIADPSGYLWRALEHLAAELERERKPKRRRRSDSQEASE